MESWIEWMVRYLGHSAKSTHWTMLVFLILMGFVLGTVLGEILRPYVPLLGKGASAGMDPQTLRLADTFSLTFGFKIHLNLATIIGVILAFVVSRKM